MSDDPKRAYLSHATVRAEEEEDAEREIIAAKAREFAAHYPDNSDGQNTFVLLAEWIEQRALTAPTVPREPTDAMLIAGRKAYQRTSRFVEVWHDMYDASIPPPPAEKK